MPKGSIYYVNPAQKNIIEFQDFSGGLNSTSANDTLKDYELPNITNKDLGNRGSTKRRYGMVKHLDGNGKNAQGYFRYFRSDTDFDEIQVAGGEFLVNGVVTPVGDGSIPVQTTRSMQAVQFEDKLYIASGSGLISYDGENLEWVTPYAPKPLEALYVGTNALADNPDQYMQDGEAAFLYLDGVTFSSRYGVANEGVTLTAYVRKPAGAVVEYKFESRYSIDREDEWKLEQDWSTTKTCTIVPEKTGDMVFQVSARIQGSSDDPRLFIVPKYTVKPTADPNDNPIDSSNIKSCNRIMLHWNRLILYGDEVQQDVIYISELNNPAYFPTPNTLRFENPKKEPLTTLVRFRDNIVAFTHSTTQALFGKSPRDFQRVMLNSTVGCIAPESPAVIGNYIAFLSADGIYILKSLAAVENQANVERIDTNVAKWVSLDTDACGASYDNQYHIVFPQRNIRLRFYYDYGVWTKDESPKLRFSTMYRRGDLYGMDQQDGTVYRFNKAVFDDDGYVYDDVIETKFYDFGVPLNPKKLKELQMLIADIGEDVKARIEIFLDTKKVFDESVTISTDNSQSVEFNQLPSLLYKNRMFGKGLKTKVIITHSESKPFQLMSLGFIFKLKHP